MKIQSQPPVSRTAFGRSVASLAVLAAVAGCGGGQQAGGSGSAPAPAVANRAAETGEVLRSAGLPAQLTFGGRVWKAHEVHWVQGSAADRPPVGSGAKVTQDAPGALGEKVTEDAGDPRPPTPKPVGKFVPAPGLAVDGWPIYRGTGLDEKLTDNIYLQAEGTRKSTPDTLQAEPGTAFVEYDAGENLVEGLPLPQLLKAAGLPDSVPEGARTWRADEVQVYDADVFGSLQPLPRPTQGHPAFQGSDPNVMFLQGEIKGAGPPAGAAGSNAAALRGPVFVRYRALARAEDHLGTQ